MILSKYLLGSFCPGIFKRVEKKECAILDFEGRKISGITSYYISSDRVGFFLLNKIKSRSLIIIVPQM